MKTLIVMPNGPMMQEQADKVWESLPEEEKVYKGASYLHGQLDIDMGIDLFFPVNASAIGLTETFTNTRGNICSTLSINGQLPVSVITASKPCIGYFWTIVRRDSRTNKIIDICQYGLICYSDDKNACEYAFRKMQEKSYDI